MDTDEIYVGRLGIRYLVDGAQQGSMGIFELTEVTACRHLHAPRMPPPAR